MSYWKLLAAAIVAGALITILFLGRESFAGGLAEAVRRVDALGPGAPLAFVGIYILAIVLLLPASVFLVGAGVLFGLSTGFLYAFVANTIAGALSFGVARWLGRSRLERALRQGGAIDAVDRAIREDSLRTTFLIRFSPFIPAWLMNYGLGITSVRFGHYMIASVATIPVILMYVYSGAALGDLAQLGTDSAPHRGATYYALLSGGLVATIAAILLIGRRARRILETEPRSDC